MRPAEVAQIAGQRGVGAGAGRGEVGLQPHAGRELARDERDAQQHEDRDHIFWIADRERAGRRQEEEIIGKARCEPREQPGAQTEARRGEHHRDQIEQRDIAEIERGAEQAAERGYRRDHRQRPQIIRRLAPPPRRADSATSRRARVGLARQDVHRHIVDRPHELVDDRAVTHLEPPGTCRFADDDLGRACIAREGMQAFDHAGRGNGRGGGTEPRGERKRVGELSAVLVGHAVAAPRLDMDCAPWRFQRIGEPFPRADKFGRDRKLAHRDDDPLADREAARQRMAAHMVEHLRIDRLCGAAKREFAQCRQIRFGKEVRKSARGFLRNIDFPLAQPFDQLVGRDVDNLDLGIFEDRVGHRFADTHAGEGGDDVVQALDMLDVERRIDVDPGVEQFLDILIAFRVPAARSIRVRKLVDQDQLRPPFEDRVDIHLAKAVSLVIDLATRNDFLPFDKRSGFPATMRFDHTDHDVDPGLALLPAAGQHLPRLAHAGCGAEEDLETAAAFLRRLTQKGLG